MNGLDDNLSTAERTDPDNRGYTRNWQSSTLDERGYVTAVTGRCVEAVSTSGHGRTSEGHNPSHPVVTVSRHSGGYL